MSNFYNNYFRIFERPFAGNRYPGNSLLLEGAVFASIVGVQTKDRNFPTIWLIISGLVVSRNQKKEDQTG